MISARIKKVNASRRAATGDSEQEKNEIYEQGYQDGYVGGLAKGDERGRCETGYEDGYAHGLEETTRAAIRK